jgi:geranylgeranyl diphosphate synthase type I
LLPERPTIVNSDHIDSPRRQTLTIGPSPSWATTAGSATFNAVDPVPFVAAVESELATFFASRRETVASVGADFVAAVEELEQFVLRGGKRIRPTFAWTGWIGAGGDPFGRHAGAVLRVCSALELVQACALVHDDIIDSSDTRRGHPTVHVTFAQQHRRDGWSGVSADHGAAVAILLGDVALAWSDDMVREADLAPDVVARLAPVWSAMRTEVLGGQLLDITGESRGDESVESALRIDRYKTAAYTIERPLHIGAALAGAPEGLVRAYRDYGTDVGIAFQLRDDLLGVFGDPATTGKPSGDDLREGKRTVLFAIALERADEHAPRTAALLRRSIGTDLSDTEVDELRGVLTDLGAVDEVERQIADLTNRALTAIEHSSATDSAKQQLRQMAHTATMRSA